MRNMVPLRLLLYGRTSEMRLCTETRITAVGFHKFLVRRYIDHNSSVIAQFWVLRPHHNHTVIISYTRSGYRMVSINNHTLFNGSMGCCGGGSHQTNPMCEKSVFANKLMFVSLIHLARISLARPNNRRHRPQLALLHQRTSNRLHINRFHFKIDRFRVAVRCTVFRYRFLLHEIP